MRDVSTYVRVVGIFMGLGLTTALGGFSATIAQEEDAPIPDPDAGKPYVRYLSGYLITSEDWHVDMVNPGESKGTLTTSNTTFQVGSKGSYEGSIETNILIKYELPDGKFTDVLFHTSFAIVEGSGDQNHVFDYSATAKDLATSIKRFGTNNATKDWRRVGDPNKCLRFTVAVIISNKPSSGKNGLCHASDEMSDIPGSVRFVSEDLK